MLLSNEVWCKKKKEASLLEISGLDNAQVKLQQRMSPCLQATEVSFSAAVSCASTPYLSTATAAAALEQELITYSC